MRARSKLTIALLTTLALLAVGVGAADARRLELSERRIRVVWEAVERAIFINMNIGVTCQFTLEGSFHSRTLAKVSGQLVGYITKAYRHACLPEGEQGEVFILNGQEVLPDLMLAGDSLPWHIRYDSFSGTLPNIAGIRLQIINFSFLLYRFGVGCLYSSTGERPLFVIAELTAGRITSLSFDGTRRLPRHASLFGAVCAEETEMTGRANSVEVLGATTKITVRLVA
jgi:hypothetical protein